MRMLKNAIFFACFFVSGIACACPGLKSENIAISGTEYQKEQVCRSIEKATAFFKKYGFEVELEKVVAKIVFSNKVEIPKTDSNGNPTYGGGIRVLALFDRGNGYLEITNEKEPWIKSKGRTFFGLPHNKELYESVIFHELIHLLSKQFYEYENYGHAQEEYIAYAAQIDSMTEALRARVLKKCPKEECSFSDEANINDLVHHKSPHKFGVMSFEHFSSEEGGSKMLKRIYSGDFKPFDFSLLQ